MEASVITLSLNIDTGMAELADASDLSSDSVKSVGSTPTTCISIWDTDANIDFNRLKGARAMARSGPM